VTREEAARGMGSSLVLDVGTSAVKGALVTEDGDFAYVTERPLDAPTGRDGVMEQDARNWREVAREVTRDVVRHATTPDRIVLTGQMQDLTLLASDGAPLRHTLLYGDVRAQQEARDVQDALGVKLLQAWTGNDHDASALLAKALWLKRHEPDVWNAARHVFLGAADVLAFDLTGVAACDVTTASTTGLMNLETRTPLTEEALHLLDLSELPTRLPRLVPGGEQVGTVTPDAASSWGLPEGTPVHVGPGDAGATTIGAGAGIPGVASIYLGTSGWLATTSLDVGDPEAGVFTLAHPTPGRYVQVAPLLTAAGNLAWFRDAVTPDVPFDDLVQGAILQARPHLVYLPYLAGERSPFRDPTIRGAFLGLTADTTQRDMTYAVLEGVAFAYRHAADALGLTSGGETEAPWVVSGGGARSAAWMQLLADVLERPLLRLEDASNVGVRGAWHATRLALGIVPDASLANAGEPVTPRDVPADEKAARNARYQAFLAATQALRPVYAAWSGKR